GDHTYLSGVTNSLSEHFKNIAHEVDNKFFKDFRTKSVLDIGSNDGTQLKHFQALDYEVLGVESSKKTAKIANDNNIPTVNDFFNLNLVKSLNKKFDIINAAGVFFHLEELHSVTEGIKKALKEDGIFVVQFLYMKKIVDNLAFDQIYHEHLLYYNLNTIEILLERHDLSMFDAYLSPIHGGSIIGYVTHKGKKNPSERLLKMRKAEVEDKSNEFATYLDFAKRIKKMKVDNLSFLDQAKKDGKKIWGFGAPVKGNTMLNYFGIGTQYLNYLIEKNELRRGLYSPGMHIPVLIEKELKELPDIYYVLAWNFKKEILANNQHLIDKGIEFYFPVNP
ncbi:MAG: adenylosuccinate synthase, partial [Candidatus Atelocyanobacterium thalassa isolate SIO64986]